MIIPKCRHSITLRALFCCLLLVSVETAAALEQMTGHPTQVFSGNELLLLTSAGTVHRVKLDGISVEPPGQQWGDAARRHLQTLVMGRPVTLVFQRERGSTALHGQLQHGGADINRRLLSAGLARFDPTGLPPAERESYAEAERRARSAGLGIWGNNGNQPRSRARMVPGGILFRAEPWH
ncbi:MAG: thermonuclease family protein [Chromatiaceae bacterium]|nr:thermonuclease family protein [Chromatiaceae bacterium]